jgi:hypothetical protein
MGILQKKFTNVTLFSRFLIIRKKEGVLSACITQTCLNLCLLYNFEHLDKIYLAAKQGAKGTLLLF